MNERSAASAAVTAGDAGAPSAAVDLKALQDAFELYTRTTEAMEEAYRRLEERVRTLDRELQEKNPELALTTEYLNSILDSMSDGVIAVDVDGAITTFNRAAESILGYTATDVAGEKFVDIFSRAFHPAEGEALSELRTRAGAAVRVHEQDAPLTDRTEQRLGSVKVFQDLREIEALREQVRRKDRLAALGEMAATVAHEIRNPLGGIRGFATLLQQDTPEEDPRHRLIQKIVTGTKNLDRVVNELLEYTRPVELDRRPYACAELVAGALALVDMEDQPGVTYETHVQPDACVVADAAKMKQVLLNLLINARQSLNGPGAIRIWSETDAPYTVICVGDTGCGIPADQLERIFSPFYTTKEKGTGLGLAVASKIVEMHGGTISATSVVGEGAVFRVRLPTVVARATSP